MIWNSVWVKKILTPTLGKNIFFLYHVNELFKIYFDSKHSKYQKITLSGMLLFSLLRVTKIFENDL